MTLVADEDALVAVHFGDERSATLPHGAMRGESPLLGEAARQLMGYFRRERRHFDVPLRMVGTDFQLRVWNALLTIPYGETRT
ncbi:MAG: cysteine methyltransferase, partial [Fretibacterium sp.]|nr:cysteine methyltransferase [Fretibacterium sp.]